MAIVAAEPPKHGTAILSQDSLLWVSLAQLNTSFTSKAGPGNKQNFTFSKANCLLFAFLRETH